MTGHPLAAQIPVKSRHKRISCGTLGGRMKNCRRILVARGRPIAALHGSSASVIVGIRSRKLRHGSSRSPDRAAASHRTRAQQQDRKGARPCAPARDLGMRRSGDPIAHAVSRPRLERRQRGKLGRRWRMGETGQQRSFAEAIDIAARETLTIPPFESRESTVSGNKLLD